MPYVQTTPPDAGDLVVSIDEAAEHCVVVADEDRAYLQGLITKAMRWAERRIARQLLSCTWTLYLDRFPAQIELAKLPVTAVTSITYVDTEGDSTFLAADQYQVDAVDPDRPARIKPAYGLSWPSTRLDTYNAVAVAFIAGYGTAADVPRTLKHAILLLVGHWFAHREPVLAGTIVTPVPMAVESLIACEDPGLYS